MMKKEVTWWKGRRLAGLTRQLTVSTASSAAPWIIESYSLTDPNQLVSVQTRSQLPNIVLSHLFLVSYLNNFAVTLIAFFSSSPFFRLVTNYCIFQLLSLRRQYNLSVKLKWMCEKLNVSVLQINMLNNNLSWLKLIMLFKLMLELQSTS